MRARKQKKWEVERSNEKVIGDRMQMILLSRMIILSSSSLDAVDQVEQHEHGPHRHLRYAKIKNPVAITVQSIAQGKQLYEKHCMVCHGQQGSGGIGPPLYGPVRIHGNAEGEIFHVITYGIAGTAMKGFKNELPEEMRWHLVNYIKSQKK